MAPTTDVRRLVRPPSRSVREAPFTLTRNAPDAGRDGDGLTLDGYGAVFNTITVIDSYEGRFREQNALKSMARSFRETPPKIQFDHGRHPMIGSIPIAALTSISEDVDPVLAPNGGAHVIARLFDNWLMQPVRDAIAAQAIDGMSYRFEVVREVWTYADGTPIRSEQALMAELDRCMFNDVPDDELPLRTLKELKIREIGPVVWPAYESTSVGMRLRSTVIDLGRLADPAQRHLLAEAVYVADRAEADGDTTTSTRDMDSGHDPNALAGALESVLGQVCELMNGVDMASMPAEIVQAHALLTTAETAADALVSAMGIPDADENSDPAAGRSKNMDAQQPTTTAGERSSSDAQQDTEPVVEHPSPTADSRRPSDAQRSTLVVGERPSRPRRLSDHNLRLRNQRDRLLILRPIGDRSP